MKKSFLLSFLSLAATVGLAFGLSACENHEHAYGEWSTTLEATCTTAGERTRACLCGDLQREPIQATGHVEGEWTIDEEADCTTQGSKHTECTVCHTTIQTQAIDATGHSYGAWTTTLEPDCTTAGEQTRSCSCGDTQTEPLQATGHSYGAWTTTLEPNCTTAGEQTRSCACGDIQTEPLQATGHTYGAWVTTLEPNCTTAGEQTRSCSCGDTQTEPLQALGHNEMPHAAQEASCTQIGWAAYVTCSRCTYSTYQELPMAAHEYVDGYCKNCGAQRASEGLIYELNYDGTSYKVKSIGTCEDVDIVIPSTYENLPVTDISLRAFQNCATIESVTLPNTLTYIGMWAFESCTALESIEIPDSVTMIEVSAFNGCTGLQTVKIGNGVTKIEDTAFYGCTNIASLTIGSKVTSIGNRAFYNCTALTELYFNAANANDFAYNNEIFYMGGSAGTGVAVTIGKEATKIPAYAFKGSSSKSLTLIKVKSVTFEEESVCKTIGSYAFAYCTSLTEINIPDSVTTIADRAFYECNKLESAKLGNGVATVEDYAFQYCSSLKSLTIGEGLTTVGEGAFYSCQALTEINFNAKAMNDLAYENKAFYSAGNSGEGITVTIGKNVTKIPAYLFYSYDNYNLTPKITEVVFEEGSVCSRIRQYAFYYCNEIETITLPASITRIESRAFSSCPQLTDVTFGGTMAQWNTLIQNSVGWIGSTAEYVVTCTDGKLDKNGVQIVE